MKTRPNTRLNKRNDDSMRTDGLATGAVRRAQRVLIFLVLAVAVTIRCGNLLAAIPAPIDLGTAADFGALAGAAISGTGSVEGDVGSGSGAIAPAITSTGTIYPTGDPVVMTALDDFAIIDRQHYALHFKDKIKILDFSMEEVRRLKPFIKWAGLTDRYLSRLVTERTVVGDGPHVMDKPLTHDLVCKVGAFVW